MSRQWGVSLVALVSLCWSCSVWAKPEVLHVYLNADSSNMAEAVSSIERGIRVAFDEVNNVVQGVPLRLKTLDHRGNAARQKLNSQKILQDPAALVMFTGIHSTTIIPNRTFINENKLLTLDPWAAGGPVTRHPAAENWIFRLSVDDSQSGGFLIHYAMEDRGCESPHLLLESSPWGDSNLKSMTKALSKGYDISPLVTRFSYDISEASARMFLRKIVRQNHDCLMLVANNLEARVIMNAVNSLPEANNLSVISHMGVTTGSFWKGIPQAHSADTRMRFLQTCYSYNSDPEPDEFRQAAFERLMKLDNTIKAPADLRAQLGFVHAYDLTRLFLSALQQVPLGDDMLQNRNAVRMALEDLQQSVRGLLKTYTKPFSVFDPTKNPEAHEALQPDDYCMGYFDTKGIIYLDTQ